MSVKINDLAKKFGIKTQELREKITEYGFEIEKKATMIEDDLAELIKDELSKGNEQEKPISKTELYEEIIEEQLEREIIKKQRKLTAGKEDKREKKEEKPNMPTIPEEQKIITIPETISVKELAEKSGISAAKIIGELMKNGILANINQMLDFETASIIADDLNIHLEKKHAEVAIQDLMEKNLEKLLAEDDASILVERPPIVCVMGHVDHGKTKLLDAIRKSNVIDTEAGHITQHIGAYQVEKNGKKITFLDTPGHEAFTAMRARGAQATDIAVLVVAADEGIKPQTLEALAHAKEAKVPIIVAINKIDKANTNVDKIKGELAELSLQAEDWGGDTIMVPVSATTGEGMENLLENILVVAEVNDIKANPNRPAVATVIESQLNQNLGPTATVIINTGTLKIMDNVVTGNIYGRIKSMEDQNGKRIRKAEPSTPVKISGLSGTPQAGDIVQVVANEKTAKMQALEIATIQEFQSIMHRGLGVDEIMNQISAGKMKTLKIVLKADTEGSLEAIKNELSKLKTEEVSIKIIHSGVGNVTESDILMASASKGIAVGFHVKAPQQVEKIAERENVEILKYDIIYRVTDDLKKLLSGLLEPETLETELGAMEVKKIFFSKKSESIVGCKVTSGKIENKAKLRIKRNGEVIGNGEILNLQKGEETVKEMKEGQECGIRMKSDTKIVEGDILEAFKSEKRIRTL